MIPYVYKAGKVIFYARPQGGEVQEYYNGALVHGVDPDKYTYADGVVTPVSQEVADQMDAAVQAIRDAEQARIEAIATEQESAGFKSVTPEEAKAYIEQQFDTTDLVATLPALQAATDLNSAMTAIIATFTELKILVDKAKETHLKEIPYLLK